MNQKRILNICLAIVASLLLVNLGVMLAPAVHAIPNKQYRAVSVDLSSGTSPGVQRALDQQGAQGWEYVGVAGNVLIFKK